MLELSGDNPHQGATGPPVRQNLIENGQNQTVDDRRPWERGPTGGPAPWLNPNNNSGVRPPRTENYDGYKNDNRDTFRALPTGPSRSVGAPWQKQQQQYGHSQNASENPDSGLSLQSFSGNPTRPTLWQRGNGGHSYENIQGFPTQEGQFMHDQNQEYYQDRPNPQYQQLFEYNTNVCVPSSQISSFTYYSQLEIFVWESI